MRNALVAPLLDEYVNAGSEVLDLGGFDGSTTQPLIAKGARVSLVDLDEVGVKLAAEKGINAIAAPAEQVPFPDEAFDVVVCCDLIQSLPYESEERVAKEIGRVLKRGGILVMTVPDPALHLPFVDMKRAYKSWQSREGITHHRLLYLLELAGIEVLASRDYFSLVSRLYYSLAFFKNLPRRGTKLKRRLWRHVFAGESVWCPAPQAHLVVGRRAAS